MQEILVIRFSALGDLCLLAGAITRFRGRTGGGDCRVTLVTKAAFAPLLATAHGIDEVIELEESGAASLRRLAKRVRTRRWDAVVDAHSTLRSALLLGMLGRRPDARLAKDSAARWAFLKLGTPSRSLRRSVSDRYDELFRRLDLSPHQGGITPDAAPEPTFAPVAGESVPGPILGLAPGAQWETKQWPEENFADLLESFRRRSGAAVRIFLGPREEAWFAGSRLAAAAEQIPRVEIVRNRPLTEVAGRIADCSLLVTNDSGLLHLAEAAGVRVIACFGPTVREFGFFPRLAGSRVLEISLDCRPCSRHGKRACHRDDLACLRNISTGQVLDAVLAAEDWPAGGTGAITEESSVSP